MSATLPQRKPPAWQRLLLHEELVDAARGIDAMRPVRRAQLELLLQKFSLSASVAAALYAFALWVLFYALGPSPRVLLWAVLVHSVQAVRYTHTRRLLARGPVPDAELGPELHRQTRLLWMLGGAWSLAPWLLMRQGDTASMALMAVFIVGMVSSAAAVLSSHRQTVAAFVVPAMTGLVLALAWSGGLIGWIMALALAQYSSTLLKWTAQQVDLLVDSLQVRFEKENLAQRLAEQVERVEAGSREKTRFLASASHDLRQPLHAVSLFTAVLEHALAQGPQAETVARLGNSVRMLSASLDGMLDVSRLDAGAVQPRIETLAVHPLFVSLQNTYGGRAQEKGLRLRIRAPGNLHVASDRLLLERLLGNLLDNAIKYTEQGGVLVAARPAHGPAGEAVRFEIVDTGMGIAEDQQGQVFEEFYQVGNPQRDRAHGLGLGLSIVRRLSALLQHPVALRSRVGRGTRCSVQVRAVPPVAAVAAPPLRAAARTQLPAHVLVLDDEVDSGTATAAWLGAQGCRVQVVTTVEQARAVLQAHADVGAVVADFRLAGPESGLDFLGEVRRTLPGIRCLLVTGETAPERISAIRASGLPCLFKPVQPERLVEALSASA
ncbi:ATP-binding response regulator [Pseudorhodoferax sp.]|uniref:ATP-binding response regulator n=1 Tax=Pseudorhodoferax sp. TaxID=1993553 RepID=UPI002DD6698F|nr:ATP-binding protein [Pseudorhodoferax sp.]